MRANRTSESLGVDSAKLGADLKLAVDDESDVVEADAFAGGDALDGAGGDRPDLDMGGGELGLLGTAIPEGVDDKVFFAGGEGGVGGL